jgi:PAS domain-containing protein
MASEDWVGKDWQEVLADARHMTEILAQETCEGHVASEVLGQCVECFRLAVDAPAGLTREPQSAALQSEIGPLCDLLRSVLGRHQLPETVNQELRWLRAANRSLTLEKNRYHNIFAATTNLVLVADYEGRITHTNPEAERCFPYRSAIGRFFWQLLDLRGVTLEQVLADYRLGESHEIPLFDGSRCYALRILPFSPALSGVRGYILILNDITVLVDQAQKLETLVAERTHALINSEQMLRHIFNSAGNGIMLVDESGAIVKANQRAGAIYGCAVE